MNFLKKLLRFNIILIMLIILSTDIFKYNVYATSINTSSPIKIAVFFDNSNAMYLSLLKDNFHLFIIGLITAKLSEVKNTLSKIIEQNNTPLVKIRSKF